MKPFTVQVELQPFCYTDYNYIVEIVTFNVHNYIIIIFTTGTHANSCVVGHQSHASYFSETQDQNSALIYIHIYSYV